MNSSLFVASMTPSALKFHARMTNKAAIINSVKEPTLGTVKPSAMERKEPRFVSVRESIKMSVVEEHSSIGTKKIRGNDYNAVIS